MSSASLAESFLAPKKLSTQMRAVLAILSADVHLMNCALPFVNIFTETIDWDGILGLTLSPGHQCAIAVAHGIWTDEQRPHFDFFNACLSLEAPIQTEILRALALRWGLKV